MIESFWKSVYNKINFLGKSNLFLIVRESMIGGNTYDRINEDILLWGAGNFVIS